MQKREQTSKSRQCQLNVSPGPELMRRIKAACKEFGIPYPARVGKEVINDYLGHWITAQRCKNEIIRAQADVKFTPSVAGEANAINS